jgi:hypothetical protein
MNGGTTSCFFASNDVEDQEVKFTEPPPMDVAVWFEPADVDAALARLGLSVSPLTEALLVGWVARASCTENDAPNFPGFVQWGRTLRALRERLVLLGWTRCDDGNFATSVSPDKQIAIAVASGNEDTGRRDAVPSTRSAKGPSTAAAVSINAGQLEMFPEVLPAPIHDGDNSRVTWLVLFHADGKELRAELSLPVDMDAEGHIKLWRERIILPAQPLDAATVMPEPDFGPNIEIEVKRRT